VEIPGSNLHSVIQSKFEREREINERGGTGKFSQVTAAEEIEIPG